MRRFDFFRLLWLTLGSHFIISNYLNPLNLTVFGGLG